MIKGLPKRIPSRRDMDIVLFKVTNESIPAIIGGLDVKQEDTITAIGGSGDQAFAMASYGANVRIVDNSKSQLDFIKDRIQRLRKGEIEQGLFGGGRNRRHLYEYRRDFFDQSRIQGLLGNLDRIEILPRRCIIGKPKIFRRSNKAYLSNALEYSDCQDPLDVIDRIATYLDGEGLVYTTEGAGENMIDHPNLRIDFKLTDIAVREEMASREGWDPIVIRKKQTSE